MQHYAIYNSPIGPLSITADEQFITQISFDNSVVSDLPISSNSLIDLTFNQLNMYFDCKLKNFSLPLKLNGTAFQNAVWQELQNIPYSETFSYREVAQKVNNPKAYRAVGNCNHNNPLVIVVPCHRVIKNDGSIGGYGGGLWRKQFLLELEQTHSK